MPIFEYNCKHCNYTYDKLVTRRDTQEKCPLCQGKVTKIMSTFSVGAPQDYASNLPPGTGPKMCTNC